MRKFIGFLCFLNIAYSYELPVKSIIGIFHCSQAMIKQGEIGIWDGMRGYNYPLTDGNKNEVRFIWEFLPDITRNSFDHVQSIKLKFQYRVQNLINEFNTQNLCLTILEDNGNIVYSKILDNITEEFTSLEISLNKEFFLNSINNNNQYSLHFKTNAPGYKDVDSPTWTALSIRTRNENQTLTPILIIE